MTCRWIWAAVLGAVAVPALAVGMGPLEKSGITDGPAKGFYLTVLNPYGKAETFRTFPAVIGGEAEPYGVTIRPARFVLAAGRQRRVLVVVEGLDPGETRTFRVCAEKDREEGMIHARVCSKLSARRISAR
ncbi:hypothetical protein [Qipengyuania qiaonensis]|uniref:Uncharacterized protein n=1 Tax=Qipengyuania qiaonensis TaxID=2867240 RepID=A0ABS7JCZ6_9SPHN|nr:hypothetical protein [Qipengyuania qiaonensis]MBX7483553.1 hypothetical protein [Qipengyuania qiaonensis]